MTDEVNVMPADDAVAGWAGKVHVTFYDDGNGSEGGNRYVFARIKNVEAKVKFNNQTLSILGTNMKKHKQGTGEGTGSATLYYFDSMIRKKIERYKNKGKLFRFDMEVLNDDIGSNSSSQMVTLKECLISELTLAKLDADAEVLEEDFPFTFDDYSVDKPFGTR